MVMMMVVVVLVFVSVGVVVSLGCGRCWFLGTVRVFMMMYGDSGGDR